MKRPPRLHYTSIRFARGLARNAESVQVAARYCAREMSRARIQLRGKLVIAAFHLVLLSSIAVADNTRVAWNSVGEDLEIGRATISSGIFSSSSLTAVRTTLTRYRFAVLRASEVNMRRTSVKSLCKARHAAVCINANFFDEQGRPLGLVISRGVSFQRLQRGGDTLTAVLTASRNAVRIAHRDYFNPNSITEGVQAGPRLLSNRQIVKGLHEPFFASNLSGACTDTKHRLVLYRITSGILGCSLEQLQKLLKGSDFNCQEALNFDGGGSSQLYISGSIPGAAGNHQEIDQPGDDNVPVAVALVAREQ